MKQRKSDGLTTKTVYLNDMTIARKYGIAWKKKVKIYIGDITQAKVDAIVNAANNRLLLGSGVSGAIRTNGGKDIQAECDMVGPIPLGEAAVTNAGTLHAHIVIHAASMKFGCPTDDRDLESSIDRSFLRATQYKMKSIAFPAVGTGVGGFPIDTCAQIMMDYAAEYLNDPQGTLELVEFTMFDEVQEAVFKDALACAGTNRQMKPVPVSYNPMMNRDFSKKEMFKGPFKGTTTVRGTVGSTFPASTSGFDRKWLDRFLSGPNRR